MRRDESHAPPIVIATRNRDKAREIRRIFSGSSIALIDLSEFPAPPEVEETGATLEENALIKARSAFDATGLEALADDSGLFVDALGGDPGVRSARFAGEHVTYADNNARLLEMMEGLPEERRGARFVCVVAFVHADGSGRTFRGVVEGRITMAPDGDGGFGYDPLFHHPPSGTTFARLSPEEKDRISHRYLAFSAARRYLERYHAG